MAKSIRGGMYAIWVDPFIQGVKVYDESGNQIESGLRQVPSFSFQIGSSGFDASSQDVSRFSRHGVIDKSLVETASNVFMAK